jgi:hypothetical protein
MDPHHDQPLDRRAQAAQLALERPDTPDAIALIEELESHLASRYPPGERRAPFGAYRDDPLSLYFEKRI